MRNKANPLAFLAMLSELSGNDAFQKHDKEQRGVTNNDLKIPLNKIEQEYELIKQKKSKLPARQRAFIVEYMEKRSKK